MSASKTVIIVGPGEHFGFQLAKRFGSENFHVILVARNSNVLNELCERLRKENISCSYLSADTTDKESLSKAFRELTSIPPIVTVIFNVKMGVKGNGLAISPDQLTEALNTNVSGALVTIQSALPFLSQGSSIILTGGGYKDTPDPEKLALSVSRGALHTLFLSLIEPLQIRGVKIGTVIIDGMVREGGPIHPEKVSEAFWNVYQGESGKIIKVI